MKVLVACEESQEVCKAFRAKGHESYSCDIQEPSGGHPEWHILGDALVVIKGGQVTTMDGQTHDVGKWDLLIAHPPCTYLSNAGAKRISAQYLRPVTMGSLFDGIGGFPLVFERHNGKGTARWASEIEEFPIAVTKLRFGED